jgi:hypothetical protein
VRRAIFFDVENSSRPEHIAAMLDHLSIDWTTRATELFAVGNWRVIGHESARLLAARGAHLVHSAPSTGVRDWSDLRIAVAAGAWLASGRPGDTVEIISDDQAFDAVGDVAASLGVTFHRMSFRKLAGLAGAPVPVEVRTGEPSRSRRRRRGGRRDGRRPHHRPEARTEHPRPAPVPMHVAPPPPPPAPRGVPEPHTAPADEIVATVEDLLATSPEGVKLDTLANALKERGFRRPPGSPRLITRLRHLKSLEVTPSGIVRLTASARAKLAEEAPPAAEEPRDEGPASEPAETVAGETAGDQGQRRRRRRRGRRRGRGRGGNGEAGGAGRPPGPPVARAAPA